MKLTPHTTEVWTFLFPKGKHSTAQDCAAAHNLGNWSFYIPAPRGAVEGRLGQSVATPQVCVPTYNRPIAPAGAQDLPQVTFVILNTAFVEKFHVFFLKRFLVVMRFLLAYIFPNCLQL